MLCDQCADYVAGTCHSEDDDARKLHGAATRDQREIGECNGFREREERPADDPDEIEDRVLGMLRSLRDSEGLPEDATPEERTQCRADDACRPWKGGPRLLTLTALEEWVQVADDLRDRLIRLLSGCAELEKARGQRYRLTWRTTAWTSGGSPVWGSSKPIPQPQREKFQIAESWEIILHLPVWLCLDTEARDRLLHHELMHAATLDRGHPVAEWPETVARYGLGSKPQALLAVAGIVHPSARVRIETWGMLPSGQLTMIPTPGLEMVEVRVPEGA